MQQTLIQTFWLKKKNHELSTFYIMKTTKIELRFVYFLELYNVYFYEVLWNSEKLVCEIFY